MMDVFLIRHARKEHENGCFDKRHPFDPGLTGDPRDKIRRVVEDLLQHEGAPDLIYVSPLKRTRETAWIIQAILNEKGHTRVTVAEPAMGEYLGNWTDKIHNGHMDPQTLLYGPIVDANIAQFEARVLRAFDEMRARHPDQRIWVVTHGLVMKTLANRFTGKTSLISELGAVRVKNDRVWIRRGSYWISQMAKPTSIQVPK